MTVPDEVFSCCCDWGFEFIKSEPGVFYISCNNTERIVPISQEDGTDQPATSFTNASFVRYLDPDLNLYGTNPVNPEQIWKYDIEGNLLWNHTPNSLNSSFGAPTTAFATASTRLSLTIDADRNVYYAGNLNGTTVAAETRAILVKLDSDGNHVWSIVKTPPTDEAYVFIAPTVNDSGDVFVCGHRQYRPNLNAFGLYNFCFDTDGNEIWSDVSTNTAANSGAFDQQECNFGAGGDVLIMTQPSSLNSNIRFRNYDSSGAIAFTLPSTVLPGVQNVQPNFEYFNGSLYVVYTTSSTNIRMVKYSGSSLGTLDWQIDVPFTNTLLNRFLKVDNQGNVYLAYTLFDGTNFIGHYTKRSVSDGSEVFSDSISGSALWPLIPPGRPPVFI